MILNTAQIYIYIYIDWGKPLTDSFPIEKYQGADLTYQLQYHHFPVGCKKLGDPSFYATN